MNNETNIEATPGQSLTVGMLLFPAVTQLDLTGAYEVFARLPQVSIHLIAAARAPVRTQYGLVITPDTDLEDAPRLDILFVPGGPGTLGVMENDEVMNFLRWQGEQARYVTAVCTGALLLGAAGLLRGYRATTHWLSRDLLPRFGAQPVAQRVVVDRNRITAAGVTAGVDFGLVLASTIYGEAVAREIQLMIEYDPAPPFDSGTPETAGPDIVTRVTDTSRALQEARTLQIERVVARMQLGPRP
jgi:cyclohexyl-isocyanide hydratase